MKKRPDRLDPHTAPRFAKRDRRHWLMHLREHPAGIFWEGCPVCMDADTLGPNPYSPST